MESYVRELLEQMEMRLEHLSATADIIDRSARSVKLVRETIDELRKYLRKTPFPDPETEILFFKSLAPEFYLRYFYFIKVCSLELSLIGASKEDQLSCIETELLEIDRFLSLHKVFARYFYMGSTDLDEKFFTRNIPEVWMLDEIAAVIDENFCLASFRVAWIKAYAQYRLYLDKLSERLKNPDHAVQDGILRRKYRFKGTGADAAELIYPLYKLQLITVDGEPATIKEIKELWDFFFDMNLGNISEKNRINQSRKKDKTPFLNSLILALTQGK